MGEQKRSLLRQLYLPAVLCTALWGSAAPCVKRGYELFSVSADAPFSQLVFAGWRFALAGILVLLVTLLKGHRIVPKRDEIKPILAISLFQSMLQYVCYYIGLSGTTGTKGSVLSGTQTFFALLLALCMLTTIGAASACCTSACCTKPSGTDEAQTMEETCPCIIDGKAMDDCACMTGMCDEKCSCGEKCDCAEKKLEMLTAEMNAVFEKNMDLWNRFFGMMDKQPDMDMSYADYLTAQLETSKEKFTEEEYALLLEDIETIRRLDAEMEKIGVPCGIVNNMERVCKDPQLAHRKTLVRVEVDNVGDVLFPGPAVKFASDGEKEYRRAPRLGEHNEEILKELENVTID